MEAFGQAANSRFPSERPPFDCQERLMLPGLDPGRARDAFTEIQEAANFKAEVAEGFVVDPAW